MVAVSGASLPDYRYSQPSQVEFWVIAVLIPLLVPVQCYAEELAYRGFMMRTLGAGCAPGRRLWRRRRSFMFSHTYDAWGLGFVFADGRVRRVPVLVHRAA